MAITKPRNRVVLFRLTQEEFNQVQQACAENDARSVSDYARARILGGKAAPGSGSAEVGAGALAELRGQVRELTQAVERLTQIVEASHPARADAASASYGGGFVAKQGS